MKRGTGLIGLLVVAAIGGSIALIHKFAPGIFKIILGVGVAAIAAIVALIVISVVLAVRSSSGETGKDKKKASLDAEQVAILSKGRENLMELRRLVMRVKNREVHYKATEICNVADKILQTLKQKPQKIQNTRQFFNYYLPTLGEILSKYQRIEESGVPHEETTNKVNSYLVDIKRAMDKQYENLFADDMLDMTVEMEAMKMAVKRDGLISDESVEIKDGEHTINLTL